MRFLLLVTAVLSLAHLAFSAKSFCDISYSDETKGFVSLLNEEFNDVALNRNIWTVIQSDERLTYSFACGRDALCTNNNVYIEDGNLVFRTKKQERQSPTKDFLYTHTTGGVHTRDKFTIEPTPESITRICVRGKLPTGEIKEIDGAVVDTGKGLWPAYWTLASNARNTGKKVNDDLDSIGDDKRPVSFDYETSPIGNLNIPVPVDGYTSCNPDEGELDIMEHYDSRPSVETTFHYQLDLDKGNCKFPDNHGSVYTTVQNVTLNEYHEYGVEIGPDYISYYFDSKFQVKWIANSTTSKSGKVMNLNNTSPHYLYLNTAYGGPVSPYDDKYMPEEGFLHRIDHVKVVQYKPGNEKREDFVRDWLPGILVLSMAAIALVVAYLFSRKPQEEREPNREALINDSY